MPIVQAGQTVQATVSIQNIGQQTGDFTLEMFIVPEGGSPADAVERFYTESGFDVDNPAPVEAETLTQTIQPGEVVNFIMFSGVWADGDPLTFNSEQVFDVIIRITVEQTGVVNEVTAVENIIHQTLTPPEQQITDVQFTVQAAA